MVPAPFIVVVDANVLFPLTLRDTVLRAAAADFHQLRWSKLDAHAMLGERNLSSWPTLSLHHFELGVAIGSLSVGEDFDGVLPWGFVENRPFLRCLHGLSRALLRCERREDAAAALRRLLRLDPTDPLGAQARLAAMEAGKTWRELEKAL